MDGTGLFEFDLVILQAEGVLFLVSVDFLLSLPCLIPCELEDEHAVFNLALVEAKADW